MRRKGLARAGWSPVLDSLPTSTVCALTGLLPQNLSTIRNGRLDSPSATERLGVLAAAALHPDGSLVIERGLVTLPRLGTALAKEYAEQPARWPGLLKQTLRHATHLRTPADVDLFFSPPAVRDPRLLALLGATAALAAHRIDHGAPGWSSEVFLAEPWDVLDEGTSPVTSPVEFAARGVLLDVRHLREPERTASTTSTYEGGATRAR